jgi:hypothetical protein
VASKPIPAIVSGETPAEATASLVAAQAASLLW